MTTKSKIIIGIDEAGRGALAAPVTAAAVIVRRVLIINHLSLKGLKDSKQLTPKKREKIFAFLKDCPAVEWGIGRVGERVIDKINIFEATKLAMKRAVFNLEKKIGQEADLLLIDGNFAIPCPHIQKSIIKGDEKVLQIKLASIVAKVNRDRMLVRYHKQYPEYGFEKHKGYGTAEHFATLAKYGPCQLHRKTFRPVIKLL